MLTKQSDKPVSRKDAKEQKKAGPKKNKTNAEAKSRKQKKKQQRQEKRKNKKPRRRIFPIWLRLIVILLLAAGALILGLMIGYGILGDGKALDALKMETWQHIVDIVKKSE